MPTRPKNASDSRRASEDKENEGIDQKHEKPTEIQAKAECDT